MFRYKYEKNVTKFKSTHYVIQFLKMLDTENTQFILENKLQPQ